jgi:hypothetical protein
MGNTISLYDHTLVDTECIHMSNGLTSVFVSTLVLSGSALARTDRQRELIVWLAEHDQAVVGIGTVGFSLTDMPWTPTDFEAEKQFLLQVITAAQAKTHWELLGYTPNEALLLPRLAKFAQLMQQFTADHVDPSRYHMWLNTSAECAIPPGFPCCDRHQTLLHWRGCIVCNDLGIAT